MKIPYRLGVGTIVFAAALCDAYPTPASADEFVLANGARIDGEFLNADQSPRTTFEVKLASGTKITFARDQIQDVIRHSSAESEYDTLRHQQPDTAEGHWNLAEWCRENKLTEQRKLHLQRVIELEPNNPQARAVLGYTRIQGQWRTQAEHLSSVGKVEYKGKWRYPYEIEILEAKEKADKARKGWYINIRQYFNKSAADSIVAINDPAAVDALKSYYEKEDDVKVRELYVRALGNINTGASEAVLCEASLTDSSNEVRQTALEILAKSKRPSCVDFYIKHLTSNDNIIVNRAGVALSYFKDPRSIAPLIDALKTIHTTTIVSGNAGQIGAGFGGQVGGGMGGGLAMGQSTSTQKNERPNRDVLESLQAVIGHKADFQFDEEAWRHWYSSLKRARAIDVRRS